MATAKKPKESAEKPKRRKGGPQPGSGRPSKASQLGLVELLDKCWTKPDRELCVTKLSEMARNGNFEAIKLLLSYGFGRPKEIKEVSGPEGGAIQVNVNYVNRPIS